MSRSVVLKSPAKINLGLEVLGKRPDGYHEICTIMQKISLEDLITIKAEELPGYKLNIQISSTNLNIPTDSTNLALKAAEKLLQVANIKSDWSISISIRKAIPVGAGLGGGSSNAATTLMGLNSLLELGLSKDRLSSIGQTIGADVPFFLFGPRALAKGIGEKLEQVELPEAIFPKDVTYLLAFPGIPLSSKEVYERSNFVLTMPGKNANLPDFLKDIAKDEALNSMPQNQRHMKGLDKLLQNDLEPAAMELRPIITKLKSSMFELGAVGAAMSGSGSTVFGVFTETDQANRAEAKIRQQYNLDQNWYLGTVRNIN